MGMMTSTTLKDFNYGRFNTSRMGSSMSNIRHNKRFSPEYNSWFIMKQRCYNPNASSYIYYGGKGIKVCDEWLNDFQQFYEDMGPRPNDNWGLTRKNREDDFSPSNCEWAPPQRRRPSKYFLTYNDETYSLKEWAEKTNVPYQTIRNRFLKKIPPEEILNA